MYSPLVKEIDLHFTFDEAKEILYKALAPLGEEYIGLLKRCV